MAKIKTLKKTPDPKKKIQRPSAAPIRAAVQEKKPAPPAAAAPAPAKGDKDKKVVKTPAAGVVGTAIITKGLPPAPAEDTRVKVSVVQKSEPGSNGSEPLTEAQLRKVKTGLSRKDLEHYRQLLSLKRAELLGDVESLKNDAKNNAGSSISYEHMADTGSDNYEQEFTLGLVESERKLLQEIDDALARIQGGTYGVCMEKGVPIDRARLDAKPWAKYCIQVAREREKRGLPTG